MKRMMLPQYYVTVMGRPHGVWQGPAIPLWPVRTAEVQQVVVPTLFAHLTKAGHVVYDAKLGIYRVASINGDHVTLDPTDAGVTLAYGRLGGKDDRLVPAAGKRLMYMHLDFYDDGKIDDYYISAVPINHKNKLCMRLECCVRRGRDLRKRPYGKHGPNLSNMLFVFEDIMPESLTDLYYGVLKEKRVSK